MSKFNFSLTLLAGLGMVGIFVLIGLGKDINIVLPIVTMLVGAVIGVNKENIMGLFRK